METITRDVRDLNSDDRLAIEHVLGRPLGDNQQIAISVLGEETPAEKTTPSEHSALPEWCRVFAGMSEEEVEAIERVVAKRSDLSRTFD